MTKRLDDIGFGNLKLLQDDEAFCYGVDAVLLSHFASKRNPKGNCIDLGTGSGIIPLILSYKTLLKEIYAVEIQKSQYALLEDNIEDNSLKDRIIPINMNINQLEHRCSDLKGYFQVLTSNPPYTEKGKGILSSNESFNLARHELTSSLEDFIKVSNFLLKDKGLFYMVHRPSRIADIFEFMRKYKIEPREIVFISPYKGKSPNIVLIEGIKNGGKNLNIRFEYVRDDSGEYSAFVNEAYNLK